MKDINEILDLVEKIINEKDYTRLNQIEYEDRDILIINYVKTTKPRKKISVAWDFKNEYFMIQQSYRRHINDKQFLIRYNEIKYEEEIIDDMEGIFEEWDDLIHSSRV
ncbi:hypothetical protein [Gorillibacterium sp. sgz5001074]|uniref:hypothetical protein n=1 Tax=Gorillibacterium sp. sgz5001074 TaxID=3446695 RepID=UPI003F67C150